MNANDYVDALFAVVFFVFVACGILGADQESTAEIEKGLWGMLCICTFMVAVLGSAMMLQNTPSENGFYPQNTFYGRISAVAVRFR